MQNEQSIYEQMRAERLQEASQYRALGQEQADITRASADQLAAETLAEAEETAGKTRAQTEKEAAALLVLANGHEELRGAGHALLLRLAPLLPAANRRTQVVEWLRRADSDP